MAAHFDLVRRRRAERDGPSEQPPEVPVGVVLPRVADAAEDLDGDVADGGEPRGEGLEVQRRDMALGRFTRVGRPGGVEDAAGRELDRLQRVDEEVLDGLEGADRLPELVAYLGVLDRECEDGP